MAKKRKAVSQSDAAPEAPAGDSPFPAECRNAKGNLVKGRIVSWFLTKHPDLVGDNKTTAEKLTHLGQGDKLTFSNGDVAQARQQNDKKAAKGKKGGKVKKTNLKKSGPAPAAGMGIIGAAAAFIKAAGGISQAEAALAELKGLTNEGPKFFGWLE